MLRPLGTKATVRAPTAVLLLARCGISLLKAKRAVEAVMAGGEVPLILPKVPAAQELVQGLREAGLAAHLATPPQSFSVKALRQRLRLTQEQFAVIYGVDLRTLQNYESGARKPDRTAIGYFKLIERAPEEIKRLRLSA